METHIHKINPWKIIEVGWNRNKIKGSESIFSIGNGAMGQRANFEEDFSGKSLQGSYIGGIYYPDKTKVGWWKNGYPEYFAKVINAPNWIGISILIDSIPLDLNKVDRVEKFERILDMKNGIYERAISFKMKDDLEVEIKSKRFISMKKKSVGAISFKIRCNRDVKISLSPYIGFDVSNDDSNWDVSVGYAAGAASVGFSTDESDAWEATVGYDLGGGASFNAGVNEGETSYATVGFSF